MNVEPSKELTLEDFGLTPEELAEIVEGAQKYLPPDDEDDD